LQKSLTAVAPAGAVTAWAFPIITGTGTASDAIYTDGVQFEEGTTPTDFSDPAETPFAYEVRIFEHTWSRCNRASARAYASYTGWNFIHDHTNAFTVKGVK
jgi:hypothetical protein